LVGDGCNREKLDQEYSMAWEGSSKRPPTTDFELFDRKPSPHRHNTYGCLVIEETTNMEHPGNMGGDIADHTHEQPTSF